MVHFIVATRFGDGRNMLDSNFTSAEGMFILDTCIPVIYILVLLSYFSTLLLVWLVWHICRGLLRVYIIF